MPEPTSGTGRRERAGAGRAGKAQRPERSDRPVRDTIVTAVEDLIRRNGWTSTTMVDVATAAGVSRQTVYNEFGSRHDLLSAYVAREIDRMVTGVEQVVRANGHDPYQAMAQAFAQFLRLAANEPLVLAVTADAESGEVIRLLTEFGLEVGAPRVTALIVETFPMVATKDARTIAELLCRLGISCAVVPSGPAGATAEDVTRALAPFALQVLTQGGWHASE